MNTCWKYKVETNGASGIQNTLTKEEPISVEEVIYKRKDKDQIYAVMYNGKLRDLRYQLKESGTMVLVYADSETGKMI